MVCSFGASNNGAAVPDAIAYSARLLAKHPGDRERVLLLLSETRDHGSHFAALDEVVRLIGENYISVYALLRTMAMLEERVKQPKAMN